MFHSYFKGKPTHFLSGTYRFDSLLGLQQFFPSLFYFILKRRGILPLPRNPRNPMWVFVCGGGDHVCMCVCLKFYTRYFFVALYFSAFLVCLMRVCLAGEGWICHWWGLFMMFTFFIFIFLCVFYRTKVAGVMW